MLMLVSNSSLHTLKEAHIKQMLCRLLYICISQKIICIIKTISVHETRCTYNDFSSNSK